MIITLLFDLPTVVRLANHAATAALHRAPACPALLLASSSNGVCLTSSGLPALPALAGQPGTLREMAAFAGQCQPGTPWSQQPYLPETPVAMPLPLYEPLRHPLITQLRSGAAAGYTTLRVLLTDSGINLAVGRRRSRTGTRRSEHR